jgi:hypothetical protein
MTGQGHPRRLVALSLEAAQPRPAQLSHAEEVAMIAEVKPAELAIADAHIAAQDARIAAVETGGPSAIHRSRPGVGSTLKPTSTAGPRCG